MTVTVTESTNQDDPLDVLAFKEFLYSMTNNSLNLCREDMTELGCRAAHLGISERKVKRFVQDRWHDLERHLFAEVLESYKETKDDGEFGISGYRAKHPEHDQNEFDGSRFAELPDKPRGWIVNGWIPQGKVTLLQGDGGTGKSTMAAQLAVSSSFGLPWLGLPTTKARVLYVAAEDPPEEMRPIFAGLTRTDDFAFEGVTLKDFGAIKFWDLSDGDSLLVTKGDNGTIKPTEHWGTLKAKVAAFKPGLVIIDSLVDVFGGDENNRVQVKQFMAMLAGLGCTVVLLGHPSVQGMVTGRGTSGSTAWRNAGRSMMFVTKRANGIHHIESRKVQFGPDPAPLDVVWAGGVFVPVTPENKPGRAARRVASASTVESDTERAEACTADFVDRLKASGPVCDGIKARNYAPRVFAKASNTFNAGDFAAAMFNLLQARTIESRDYLTTDRKKRSRLFVAINSE